MSLNTNTSLNISVKEKRKQQNFDFPSTSKQHYTGETLYNNLHGAGLYFWGHEKIFFDGQFYCNDLEGYNHIIYKDGSHFQGLFKENVRFGPGVLTYPNGHQDVGVWVGMSLVRLGQSKKSLVPQLASSRAGKAKLLKYRYLVSICETPNDPAKEFLKSLGANENVLKNSHLLYNPKVKNKNSLFFNKTLYDSEFFGEEDCSIDVIVNMINLTDEDLINHGYEKRKKFLKRIEQIDSYLVNIEPELESIRTRMAVVAKQVEMCRECCYNDSSVRSREQSQELNVFNNRDSFMTSKSDTEFHVTTENLSSFFVPSEEFTEMVDVNDYMKDICLCHEETSETLKELEDRLEVLQQDELFYSTIFNTLNFKKSLYDKKSKETYKVTKRVQVNEIVAWNNEALSMEILKHAFLHRKSEYLVSFSVADVLSDHRQQFKDAGTHEKSCIDFLMEAYLGETRQIVSHLKDEGMNVNLSDSSGNTAMFFAVVKNKQESVRVLRSFGVNMNQINDEGLTPLNLCLLKYLTLRFAISDWETAFLPETKLEQTDEEEVKSWYPSDVLVSGVSAEKSLTDISSDHGLMGGTNTRSSEIPKEKRRAKISFSNNLFVNTEEKENQYFFELAPRATMRRSEGSIIDTAPTELTEQMLKYLLDNGVNPNIGEVPFAALIISLFSENALIVEALLDGGANVNVLMSDTDANCLHIMASIGLCSENSEICRVLLDYQCNPNALSVSVVNKEKKLKLLGLGELQDSGEAEEQLSPLHILCLRDDFKEADNGFYNAEMASMLLKYGANPNFTYLGHTPLSLAVMSGNLVLIEDLLHERCINPYTQLGNNMGNVLTVLGLKRYVNFMPLQRSKDVLHFLVKAGVNPLKQVGFFANPVEFLDHEGGRQLKKDSRDKKPAETLNIYVQGIRNYLKELCRKLLIEHIALEAVRHLYNFSEENMLDNENAKILAEYVNDQTALTLLVKSFKEKHIPIERFQKPLCMRLVEFVSQCSAVISKPKLSKRTKGKSKTPQTPPTSRAQLHTEILDMFQEEQNKKLGSHSKLQKKFEEEESMFEICFGCLNKTNLTLTPCPRCSLLYFCSNKCFKDMLKIKTGHPCKIKKLTVDVEEGAEIKESLRTLCRNLEANCEIKLKEKHRMLHQQLLKREKADRARDVYGIKYIKTTSEVSKVTLMDTWSIQDRKNQLTTLYKSGFHRDPVKIKEIAKNDPSIQKEAELALEHFRKEKQKRVRHSRCISCNVSDATNLESIHKKIPLSDTLPSKFEPFPKFKEPDVIIKKIKKMPQKPQYFIELLSSFFPDADISKMLLPYVCHADGGQLYYRFSDEDNIFCNTYSHI